MKDYNSDLPFTYKIEVVSKDYRGNLLSKPYLGVSIEGSPYISVNQILDYTIKLAEKLSDA